MGKYDNEYKHYYRRVSDNKEIVTREVENYDESVGTYNKRYSEKSDNGRSVEYVVKGIVGTTAFSLFLFGGVLSSKHFFGEKGEKFYNDVKLAIEETGVHKEKFNEVSEMIKKGTADLLSKKFTNKSEASNDKNDSNEKKEISKNKVVDQNKELAVSSFKLSESSVESTKLGDLKYKAQKPVKNYKSISKDTDCIIFKDAEGEILSLLDGEVVTLSEEGGGKYVKIDYGDNLTGFYYNLEKANVKKGDKIAKGGVIGKRENKGDIKIKIKEKDKYLNLEEYLDINDNKN